MLNSKFGKLFLFLFVLMSAPFVSIKAAGPLTHALLTEHLFRLYPGYTYEEKMAFRAGTLFSGVRNLGQLSDEETSFPGLEFEDILNEPSPFLAGMMFHYFVDEIRNEFVQEGAWEELVSGISVINSDLYLKFLEDQIIFPSLDTTAWKECVSTIHPEELVWGVDPVALKQWHYLLDLAYSYAPSKLIFFAYLKGGGMLNVSEEELAVWNETFDGISKRADVQEYVRDLLECFAFEMKGH